MTGEKVIVTEPIYEDGLAILRKGAEVIYLPELPGQTLWGVIKEAQGVAVRVSKITADLLAQADNLKIIAKHGVGYDNIDVEAATQRHIVVVNTPEANAESVAEHNLGLMLSISKNITTTDRVLRQNRLRRREDYTGVELKDKKLGLIGLGKIGSELARKCKIAFDMKVIAYDPYVPKERAEQQGYTKVEKLDEVLGEADYVVICVPLTKETANLIGARELGLMKANAFLVNSSRGGIVDETALYDCLVKGKIAGAALDVFSQEPPPAEHPLLGLDNFIATPHIGGVTEEAMRRMAITVAEEILRVLRGERPKYPVNPQVLA
ncbi:MAG: hydroxyacid dehydrogenase [Dehalococcoidales bacterium]